MAYEQLGHDANDVVNDAVNVTHTTKVIKRIAIRIAIQDIQVIKRDTRVIERDTQVIERDTQVIEQEEILGRT